MFLEHMANFLADVDEVVMFRVTLISVRFLFDVASSEGAESSKKKKWISI